MDRRTFIKHTAATGILAAQGLAMAGSAGAQAGAPNNLQSGDMIYRPLGRTGVQVSVLGVGGSHLGKTISEPEGIRIVRGAIDRGITFMDNSWDYNDGNSEIRMGKALQDGYRQKVFLMSKIDGRTADSAAKQIDESLKRLQTDHIDLMQFHEIIRLEDPDRIFAPGGAMAAMLAAKKAGKVRFIGFTGHKDPMVHLRMLELARANDFHFDTVQMPLNVMDAHFRSFGQLVLPILVRDGIGVIGMKSMGAGVILESGDVTPIECLHYAMNLPTATVVTGIDSMKVLDQAIEAVRTFKPMNNEQVYALLAKTAKSAGKGRFELYKTATRFDSTAHHPEWLGGSRETG